MSCITQFPTAAFCLFAYLARAAGASRLHDEELNASTHGFAELVTMGACIFLWRALRDTPTSIKISTIVYALSLNMMYICSTSYHGLYRLNDDWLMSLDHAGVFALIAGGYTGLMGGVFPGQTWAQKYLIGIWSAGILGVLVGCLFKTCMLQIIVLYVLMLMMGWSFLSTIKPVMQELGPVGSKLLISGGVVYTIGMVFNLKNGHIYGWPDHTTWHLFVMVASALHFACIYYYVIPLNRKSSAEHMVKGDTFKDELLNKEREEICDSLLTA